MGEERTKRERATPLTKDEAARTLLAADTRTQTHRTRDHRVSGINSLTPLSAPSIDTTSDRYVHVRELGRGGMGRVDEAFDGALGRAVAQKSVLDLDGDRASTLLVAEAQTCAQLEHPSIVPVYDLGIDASGKPFYTMRVVRGRTLRFVLDDVRNPERATGGGRSLVQLLGVLRQVCLAVDYAHSRGVVHRDLKPENVILGEFGEVYVLDWGVAHLLEGSDILRADYDAFIAGSPGYMAPEQVLGTTLDRRTDVFALGVMLYELLAGARPFDDADAQSVRERLGRSVDVPPSTKRSGVPDAFDALVLACLSHVPAERPRSARLIADAIDRYLDVERDRLEREREAREHTAEGDAAFEAFVESEASAGALREEGEAMLAALPTWESVARKQPAWDRLGRARSLGAEAARARARAEAAYARALGRIADHAAARRGLAALHHHQFQAAEAQGDSAKMAQYLDLARTYDDGALELELSDRGELSIESEPSGATVTLSRYEDAGLLLRAIDERSIGQTPTAPMRLYSGSYLVTVRHEGREVRCPVVVARARSLRLFARVPTSGEIPEGMVPIAGGPFLARTLRGGRPTPSALADFAIGRFPVTLRQYVLWLDALPDDERARRTPSHLVRDRDGRWSLPDGYIADERARRRIAEGRELDLPAYGVSWYSATAYARWLANSTGRAYRLPTSLEWDKAMRGADGRAFPMGPHLDPTFAKLRDSRPEASQPEPVGAFPLDESPYGVRDLAGGVGDWTSTLDDGEPPPPLDAEGSADDQRSGVWRGGTWSTTTLDASLRYAQRLSSQGAWIGFRLALSLEPSRSSSADSAPLSRRVGTMPPPR